MDIFLFFLFGQLSSLEWFKPIEYAPIHLPLEEVALRAAMKP